MSEEQQEKPYQASEKKKKKLLKEGVFLRSRELSGGIMLIAAMAILVEISPRMMEGMADILIDAFSAIASVTEMNFNLMNLYRKVAFNSLLLLMPLMLPLVVIIMLAVFVFGGLGISFQLVKPKFSRLNPLTNLKRNFSLLNLFEVFKATMKLLLFFSILMVFLFIKLSDLFNLPNFGEEISLLMGFELFKVFFTMIACGIILLMVIDMIYTRIKHQEKTMMSHQELKEEFKETETNPEVKKRVRAAQFTMSRKRLRTEVPKATVVITNPTHFAVALQYKEDIHDAPIVLAKGKGPVAAEIRLLAVKNGIPIYQAPPLARALFFTANVGDAIHEALYMAVALVLSYLQQLKMYQHGLGEMPPAIQDLRIPESMQFKDRLS